MPGLQLERKMSESEALMWRLEKDPFLSSNFANITVLDQPADAAQFRRRLERAVALVPRLRQRVQPGPLRLTPPIWVDDPGFDLSYHLRQMALPAPGTMVELCALAAQIQADPFDRTRPLWEFVLVDGLADGRGALIQKMHHTITDGEGGVKLAEQFTDIERHPPERPPLDPARLAKIQPAPPPTAAAALGSLVAGAVRFPFDVARHTTDLMLDPERIPEIGEAAVATVRSLIAQLTESDKARSPLWTERSLKHRLVTLRAPLEETKEAAKVLGGTLNIAFLAAAAAAAGDYHRQMGVPVDVLRASMAISTRSANSHGNAFTLARMLVPTAAMSPAERFALIHEATEAARAASGGASLETVGAVAAALPDSVVAWVARSQTQTVDFATSNVRAAPFPCYIGGAEMLENYPVGPLAGVAFNLTLLSYNGSLDMGVHIDTAAVDDPELLRELMVAAFAEIAAAGKPKPKATARPRTARAATAPKAGP